MFFKTLAARGRILVIMSFECWTEVLRCPNCGLTGVANLSQPKHADAVIVIDTISQGFKATSSQYGDTYLCEGCDRPATEIRISKRGGGRALFLSFR
jgi:uncharacterized Zn finger protein